MHLPKWPSSYCPYAPRTCRGTGVQQSRQSRTQRQTSPSSAVNDLEPSRRQQGSRQGPQISANKSERKVSVECLAYSTAKQKAIHASGTSTVCGNSLARPLSSSQHLLECEYIAGNICLWSGPQKAPSPLGFTVHCPPPHLAVLSSLLQAISKGWFWKQRFILGHICFTPRVPERSGDKPSPLTQAAQTCGLMITLWWGGHHLWAECLKNVIQGWSW